MPNFHFGSWKHCATLLTSSFTSWSLHQRKETKKGTNETTGGGHGEKGAALPARNAEQNFGCVPPLLL